LRRSFLSALLALSVVRPAIAFAQATPPAPTPPPGPSFPAARVVRVTGEGRVAVKPDVATIMAGVEATGKDLAKVSGDVAGQVRSLHQALAQAGVAEKDVQTVRHDVAVNRPWKDGSPGPIAGYSVVDEVRVKVRDVSRLANVLDRVVAAGGNALRGLSFEKDDPSLQQRDALARAVADARGKAEAVAKAAGVTLGEVLSVAEASEAPRPIPMMARGMSSKEGGAPVSPGEVEVLAGVEVTFAIR
jgi:uncharacterized protein YggE